MDITLFVIAIFLLLAIVFLILFLLKSNKNINFIAEDGTAFETQSDLDLYNKLYEETKFLFLLDDQLSSNQKIMGFDKQFLSSLTKDGFPDLKTLIRFRKQFKLLSDLINT